LIFNAVVDKRVRNKRITNQVTDERIF